MKSTPTDRIVRRWRAMYNAWETGAACSPSPPELVQAARAIDKSFADDPEKLYLLMCEGRPLTKVCRALLPGAH